MLIDLSSASGLPPIDADACVIGAGAAGLQMARRLVDRGLKVCLAESGGLDFEQATQDLYRGANLGMPYYELDESRLRFFGGKVARVQALHLIFESSQWPVHITLRNDICEAGAETAPGRWPAA